jgi:hypothetical protein
MTFPFESLKKYIAQYVAQWQFITQFKKEKMIIDHRKHISNAIQARILGADNL